jgi:hypothetical protein
LIVYSRLLNLCLHCRLVDNSGLKELVKSGIAPGRFAMQRLERISMMASVMKVFVFFALFRHLRNLAVQRGIHAKIGSFNKYGTVIADTGNYRFLACLDPYRYIFPMLIS